MSIRYEQQILHLDLHGVKHADVEIYVEDFVDGLITVMENCKEKHEVVNIGSNTIYIVNEILDICMEGEVFRS